MSSLRATVEKVRAEKAGVEEQLAEVQNLLAREQEAHRGLQEVKEHIIAITIQNQQLSP